MSKESDQLSTSVIHRLEGGKRPVTVAALVRYAEVLEQHPKTLFDFDFEFDAQAAGVVKIYREKSSGMVPLYSLRAAAGYFGSGAEVEIEGWVKAPAQLLSIASIDDRHFAVRVKGHSMEPKISDKSIVIFRADPKGTRQDKIVLAQYRGPADPETGGSFTIKKYSSIKSVSPDGETWQHNQITLSPLNPEFEPIVLHPKDEGDFKIIAEFIAVL